MYVCHDGLKTIVIIVADCVTDYHRIAAVVGVACVCVLVASHTYNHTVLDLLIVYIYCSK